MKQKKRFTEEHCKYISDSRKGMHMSNETRLKISEATKGEKNHFYGKKHSKETKEKLSMLAKERFKNPENNPFYGKHHTKETKEKMSEKALHRDEETIEKMRIAARNPSDETKLKMSNAAKNRTEEHNRRIGITQKKRLKNPENHPNWQGGISFEPYCILFNNEFKERVRDYFNRCCYVCGKNEIDNKAKLCVHHVTYNKETCCDDSRPLFVPLCRSCHSITNYEREYWEEFFTISLEYLTNGECYIKKQE